MAIAASRASIEQMMLIEIEKLASPLRALGLLSRCLGDEGFDEEWSSEIRRSINAMIWRKNRLAHSLSAHPIAEDFVDDADLDAAALGTT